MRLTWREALTTLLLVVVGLVYYGYSTGAEIAVINETRGALAAIGLAGLGMCIVAGSSGRVGRNPYSLFMSILGVAALVLFLIGLVIAASWTGIWLAIDIAIMWGLALVFRVFTIPAHGPTHA
jgi:hypothetical protein